MTNKNEAKTTLLNSAKSFVAINGQITKANLEAEIINNICVYILDYIPKHPEKNSPEFIDEVTEIFISAAVELFPQHYSEPAITNTRVAIHQNLSWDGMPDFLKTYFLKHHNKQINFSPIPDDDMRSEIRKMAELLTSILNNQGADYKAEAIIGVLNDFRSSSRNQMEKDIDNDDLRDVEVLRKTIRIYSNLIDKIEDRYFHDKDDFKNAYEEALNIYNYYEQKYIDELEYRNSAQKQNYIETILSPLMMVCIYLEELAA